MNFKLAKDKRNEKNKRINYSFENFLFELFLLFSTLSMFHSLECVGYGLDLSSFFGVVFLLVGKISVQKSEENHLVGSVPKRMLEFMAIKELSDIQWQPT